MKVKTAIPTHSHRMTDTPNIHNLLSLGADGTSFGAAYLMASPDFPILSIMHDFLLAAMPGQFTPVVDEMTKSIAALVVAVVSRYAYAWIDKQIEKLKNRKTRKNAKSENNQESDQEGRPAQESDNQEGQK